MTSDRDPRLSLRSGRLSGSTSWRAQQHRTEVRPPDLQKASCVSADPRVVIVEDDARLRAQIGELLTEERITVVGTAGSGMEGMELIPTLAKDSYLVVLMDIRMPGTVNGIEATRILTGFDLPVAVVMFTGFVDAGIERAAKAAGAVELVTKGSRMSVLVDAVRRAWAGRMAEGWRGVAVVEPAEVITETRSRLGG